jgi:hypothetical protein
MLLDALLALAEWINLILFGALVPIMWIVLKETRGELVLPL